MYFYWKTDIEMNGGTCFLRMDDAISLIMQTDGHDETDVQNKSEREREWWALFAPV